MYINWKGGGAIEGGTLNPKPYSPQKKTFGVKFDESFMKKKKKIFLLPKFGISGQFLQRFHQLIKIPKQLTLYVGCDKQG